MKTCLAWVGGLVIALVVGVFVLQTCIRLAALEVELEPQVVYDYSTANDFGLTELRSAFEGLPASFEEGDSTEIELLFGVLGLEGYFSSFVVFLSAFETIIAASGQISDYELTVFDKSMLPSSEDMLEGFLYGASIVGENVVVVHESGAFPSLTVGASSVGAYVDATVEGTRLRIEFIMFRRGNLVSVVYVYTLPDTQPVVSVDEAARMLDLKMSETILARYGER